MKTRLLVSLLIIIPIAGTLVRSVPPARRPALVTASQKNVRRNALHAQLKKTAQLYHADSFLACANVAQQGSNDAFACGELRIAAQFLTNLGSCQFALHEYRTALDTYLNARKTATSVSDTATAGKLEINISSLYLYLGETDAAMAAFERSKAQLSGAERIKQLPKLLDHLANLQADRGQLDEAFHLYRQGIEAAARAGDLEMYAFGCNQLGYEYLKYQRFELADRALLEGYFVRKLNHLHNMESSYWNLGMLRLAQNDLQSASVLLDRAVALSHAPGASRPKWDVYSARGQVRLRQNKLPDALDDLRNAVRLIRIWRRQTFRDDATRIGVENRIQDVYSALIEAGNRIYFTNHNRALAQETFECAEANRASSLRTSLAETRDWRRDLPPEYWETLRELETAEGKMIGNRGAFSRETGDRIERLRGMLIEWESRAGSHDSVELPDLLQRTRRTLRPGEAFLAFHVASPDSYLWTVSRERFSYLWAVSREKFELYRLPPAPRIASLAAAFVAAIRQRGPQASTAGSVLYHALFGQLDRVFEEKPRWILALDEPLFDVPFAALVQSNSGRPVFLAERHALQISSGAAMLSDAGRIRTGPFVGIADAVYNQADSRWHGSQRWSLTNVLSLKAAEDTGEDTVQLERLAGSGREVRTCAAAWSGPRQAVLLEGEDASLVRLRGVLKQQPAVLHFATHILHPGGASPSGLIVLSLNRAGRHEVLGPSEIATWDLHGSLVSLSGCSSGTAKSLPATGMMGLARACQAAGAGAVVASLWPAPDDSGVFFTAFYRHLRAAPDAGPAAALQQAQLDMLRSGTWCASPAYWSSYFVTGNRP